MLLFDAHCHLQDERLRPHLDGVMERAAQAGVASMMCCGSAESDWPRVRELCGRFPQVKASFGIHPWYAGDRRSTWLATLRGFLSESPSAVGEIGLDHALDRGTFEDQESVFLAQLDLACELNRPVSVHCRQAWGRLPELIDRHGWPEAGLMFHSFSGPKELVPTLAKRGAWFSFSGSITHTRNVRGRNALAAVPPNRFLIETDAPDIPPALPPEAFVLKTDTGLPVNEPAHLPRVLEAAAEIRGVLPDVLADVTWANARLLWRGMI
ncbi:MAG: TatD family hydrolase [bacterium]